MRPRIDLSSRDEISQVGEDLNKMADGFCDLLSEIRSGISQVEAVSQKVDESAGVNEHAAKRQSSEADQIAKSMKGMLDVTQRVNEGTTKTSEKARQSNEKSEQGSRVINESMAQIDLLRSEVGQSSQVIERVRGQTEQIASITDQIKSITERTNLLALNAAIEAARAGEHGRGFAVVADEVRSLSHSTNEFTETIHSTVQELERNVLEAVDSMQKSEQQSEHIAHQSDEVTQSLNQIIASISEIVEISESIERASDEQSDLAMNINFNINEITEVSEETSDNAKATKTDSQNLIQEMKRIHQLLDRFQI